METNFTKLTEMGYKQEHEEMDYTSDPKGIALVIRTQNEIPYTRLKFIIQYCLNRVQKYDQQKVNDLLKMSGLRLINKNSNGDYTQNLSYLELFNGKIYSGLIIADIDHYYLMYDVSVKRKYAHFYIYGKAIRDDGKSSDNMTLTCETCIGENITKLQGTLVELLTSGDLEIGDESFFFNVDEKDEECSHGEIRIYHDEKKINLYQREYPYICIRSFAAIPLRKY